MSFRPPPAFPHAGNLVRALLVCGNALMIALALPGCSSSPSGGSADAPPEYQLVWPEPPNEARFVFEAELRNQSDIRKETDEERLRRILTGRSTMSEQPVYRKPSAVAARNGRIYVADPPTGSIFVFDVPRGRLFQMGVREPNRVLAPVALAVDREGRVYALDGKLNKVFAFDALGLFLFAIDTAKDITKPAGLAVSPDGQRIYVVDRGSVDNDDHKVVAYAPDGRELHRLGPRGAAPGELNIPLSATVAPDGNLHVLDSGNFRVQTFDRDGRFVSTFGALGNGLGQFSRARSIAADPDGNIYVSDASFNNVQIFNPAGELLMWLGGPGRTNLPGQFGLIGAIAVDETGRLYVSDQYHQKIEVFRRADARKQRG